MRRRESGRRQRDDRGMITAFTAVLALGLIFVAGMVYDGGQRINTYMRAADLASNAARAGAQAADPATLYDAAPGTSLSPDDATASAQQFLADAGQPGSGEVTVNGDQVTVEVTLDQTSVILTWLGTVDISASATATATPGVDAPTGGP
jgi:Flp pilus assembly protein TadG